MRKVIDKAIDSDKDADVGASDGKLCNSLDSFKGRDCSMTEAITWAYINSSMGKISPKKAPSALAWKLLRDFKKSVDYAQDLFKGIAMAKVRKENAEDISSRDEDWFDGKAEYDICARLGGVGGMGNKQ